MATFLKNLTLIILLLITRTSLTNANWVETWLPTDQNITYVGSGWSDGWNGFVPSTCFLSTTAARFTSTPGDYATVLFTGLGIYAQSFFNQSSSVVTLIFDGKQITFNPTETTPNPGCAPLFAQYDLSFTLHNLTIVNTGPQAQMWLYLDRFFVTQPGTPPTSTSFLPPTTSTSGTITSDGPTSSPASPSPLSGRLKPIRWPRAYIIVTAVIIGAMGATWLISMLTLTPIYAPIWRSIRYGRSRHDESEDNPLTVVASRLSAFEVCKDRLQAFILVGPLVAAVQALVISLTYQRSQDTTEIVINAFSFAGLALDIIGTFLGLVDVADLEKHRRRLGELKSELEASPPADVLRRKQFNRDVNACFNRAAFIGFIPPTALAFGIIFFMVAFICFIRRTQPRLVFIMTIVSVSCTMGLYALTRVLGHFNGRQDMMFINEGEEDTPLAQSAI